METQQLLAVKKQMNKKRPYFVRQESYIRPKLKRDQKWRRAKGKHSKMREGRASHKASVQAGYRSPVLVRGMNLLGQVPVLIHNLSELASLNPQRHVAIVSSTVGLRHKMEIAKKAKEMNLKTNLKLDFIEGKIAAMKKAAQAKKEKAKSAKESKKEETKPEQKPTGTRQEKTEKTTESLAEKLGEEEEKPRAQEAKALATKKEMPAKKAVTK